jgi:O-antigen/teichoic acid export membrane protein
LSQGRVDRSTAWVATASGVLGLLDVISTLVVLQLWVTTEAFGTATLAAALLPLIDRVGGSGLNAAIVREDGGPDQDGPDAVTLSSMFWLGITVATLSFAILFALRGPIGAQFRDPVVGSLLAAFSSRVIIGQLGTVSSAKLQRALRYREIAILRIVANVIDTSVKLALAFLAVHGHPELAVWCFVAGPIASTTATTIGFQILQPWRPRLAFRRDVAARAARFTAALSGGELLYHAYTNADYVVVGLSFGDAALGAYRLAYELVLDVVRLLSSITSEVAFPTFVRLAHERERLAAQFVRFTRQNMIVLGPVLAFIAIEADDLLALLYPPLPAAAATASRILCGVGALRTLGLIMPPLLAGIGEARRVFVYNLLAAIVVPSAFVVAASLAPGAGFVSVAWAWTASYPVAFVALLAMTLPRVGLAAGAYARAIAGIAACAAVAFGAGLGTRVVAPDIVALRAAAVAVVVLVVYGVVLARVERVTPAGVVRALRAE